MGAFGLLHSNGWADSVPGMERYKTENGKSCWNRSVDFRRIVCPLVCPDFWNWNPRRIIIKTGRRPHMKSSIPLEMNAVIF